MARLLLEFFVVLLNHFLFAGAVEVRLVNSLNTSCFGKVEVSNGSWGTACGRSWSISYAALVCKELKCGRAVTAHVWALFGTGSAQVWSVVCAENESSIHGCSVKNASNDCLQGQDAGVVCSASLVVIIGAVIIALLFLLPFTIIIILVMRKRRSQKHEISSSNDAVTMHDVANEDRYEETDDEDDYEKVDVDGDCEDLKSNSEEEYVNMDEPVQSIVETDDSEQDYVNVETEDSEGDYVNVESDDSEQDYVNVDNIENSCTVDDNI